MSKELSKEEMAAKHIRNYYRGKRDFSLDDILPMSRVMPLLQEYGNQQYEKGKKERGVEDEREQFIMNSKAQQPASGVNDGRKKWEDLPLYTGKDLTEWNDKVVILNKEIEEYEKLIKSFKRANTSLQIKFDKKCEELRQSLSKQGTGEAPTPETVKEGVINLDELRPVFQQFRKTGSHTHFEYFTEGFKYAHSVPKPQPSHTEPSEGDIEAAFVKSGRKSIGFGAWMDAVKWYKSLNNKQ